MTNVPGYTALSFVSGEQPTVTKWNYLPNNDSAFNSFLTGANITYSLLASGIFSGQVQTLANTGTFATTMSYVNLGGIKLLYGNGVIGIGATSSGSATLNFPTSFFNNIISSVISLVNGSPGYQSTVMFSTSVTASGTTITAYNAYSTLENLYPQYLIIGN